MKQAEVKLDAGTSRHWLFKLEDVSDEQLDKWGALACKCKCFCVTTVGDKRELVAYYETEQPFPVRKTHVQNAVSSRCAMINVKRRKMQDMNFKEEIQTMLLDMSGEPDISKFTTVGEFIDCRPLEKRIEGVSKKRKREDEETPTRQQKKKKIEGKQSLNLSKEEKRKLMTDMYEFMLSEQRKKIIKQIIGKDKYSDIIKKAIEENPDVEQSIDDLVNKRM